MSKSYEDFLYHNVCPWCGEFYSDVDHEIGCPNPKDPPPTLRGKKLAEFLGIFYEIIDYEYRSDSKNS